jgi:N-acylneuraminate cytidylyltransferase
MSKTLALIPARAGSKRIPGKNVRPLLGKPLIQWTIEFANRYAGFDAVLVSTDCERVAKLACDLGLAPPWLRSATLAGDYASMIDVVLHALDMCEQRGQVFDRLALLQATSPLRRAEHWDRARQYLDAGAPAAVGVCAVQHHPCWTYWLGENGEMRPCFPDMQGGRSQDLPPAAALNGALYLINVQTLREVRSFVPAGVRAVMMSDPLESIDIDTEADWLGAERSLAQVLGAT